jgi:hypothetical protein
MALFNLTSDGVQLLVHTILSGTVQETFDTKFNLYFDNEDFSITQDGDKSIVGFSGSAGQLISVTENGNVGYRLAQEDPNDKAEIGEGAIDLSHSSSSSVSQSFIGDYAFLAGVNTIASGVGAFSMGAQSEADGDYAFAFGTQNEATGDYSVAIGYRNEADGINSVAMGSNNEADREGSIAMGNLNSAEGSNSIALGSNNSAYAEHSVAIGFSNAVDSEYSAAIGKDLECDSYGEVALGVLNTALPGNATNYVSSDRILSVGIGESQQFTTIRKDALEIFKNGTIYADELTVPNIIDDKQLVTKEYVTGTDSAGFTLTGSDLEIDLNRVSGINYLDTTNTDNITNITTSSLTVVNGFAVIRFDTTTWNGTGEPTVDGNVNDKIGEVEFADYDTVDMVISCTAATKNVEYFYLPV